MIEFTKSYKTADGQVFASIEDAQTHAIVGILNKIPNIIQDGAVQKGIAVHILKNKDLVVDVLTTTPNSKPKARSSHGGTKTRKKTTATVITDAATSSTTDVNTPTTDTTV